MLLTNAAAIIFEEGIQKLTIDYLAKKSDLTKGGVLYHFNNKSNLLLKMNKMAIAKYEDRLAIYLKKLSGTAKFTRAYALATLDFLNNSEAALLPAVFISSLEDDKSKQVWIETSKKWNEEIRKDSGNEQVKLNLQLICDGIWFSILYTDNALKDQITTLVKEQCKMLEEGKI